MSQQVEITAKTVEEAVAQALEKWQVARDQVAIEILEEPSRGFLGFGARDAKVKVTLLEKASVEAPQIVEEVTPGVAVFNEETSEEPNILEEKVNEAEIGNEEPEDVKENSRNAYFSEEEQEAAAQAGKAFLQNCAEAMGINVMIEKLTQEDRIVLHLHGKGVGVLIGKHGKTLDALQYLTNLAANKDLKGRYFIMLDVENYRSRREETLEALARRMAAKVKLSRRPLVLEPMNAYERKIIHLALQDDPEVYTLSEGEFQDRHLVIHYKD